MMRIVLADNRQERSEHVRRILLGEGLICEADDVVGFDRLPSRLAGAKADLVLIAVDSAADNAVDDADEDAQGAIRDTHHATDAPILAIGDEPTVEAIREAMRLGAREFLSLARLREELTQALIKIEAAGQISSQRGSLISIFSPTGGVGVSTTAVNLAVRLAADIPEPVALIDLKPAPSDLALLLDIEPRHTTNDVCHSWERMDQKLLEGAMVHHSSGVRVLAQAGYPQEGGTTENSLTPEAVRQLATLVRRIHTASVIDTASTLDACQLEAMRLSNLVGLVVRPDVPGLRRARWALDTATAEGIPRDRFRLVLNRYGQGGQVDLDTVEQTLGIEVFQKIPEDHRSVNRAANRGVPLSELSKRSRISRSFSSFAKSVRTS
jgi:pilus assembly protein CpaE